MEGKTCLVTGANGGIGYETARALAKKGARIVMVARNEGRGTSAQQSIAGETGAEVDLILGDLSLVEETKRVSREVKERCSRLDVLINNAGGAYAKRVVTSEGLHDTFALNVLAPFVLTLELLDLLKASAPARIVNVSSSAHKGGKIDFDNLQHEKKYARMRAYSNTKLALNLFTFELAKRLNGTGVTCNAVNPGFVTTQPSYATRFEILFMKLLSPFGRTPEQGAIPSVFVASAPELDGVTGKYFDPKCRTVGASVASYDEVLATRLWKKAEELTGVHGNSVGPT